MDLIDYEQVQFQEIRKGIIDFLQQLSIVPIHVIPVSAALGENVSMESKKMSWYDGPVFTNSLDRLKPVDRKERAPFRLPVQDVLIRNNCSIVLGRIESGSVERDQQLIVLPDEGTARVLEVMRYGEKRKVARTGESIGLVLEYDNDIERGNVLVQQENLPVVSDHMKATIFWMYDGILSIGDDLIMQCSTQSVSCSLQSIEKRIDSSTLDVIEENGTIIGANEVGEVTFRLHKFIVFEPFSHIPELGRLVLRKQDTVYGAGIVNTLQ
jgi:sulfate adenylyltransferase subunit 1 (EFTu-like GTPase family)